MTARVALCAGVWRLPRGPPVSERVRGRRAALSIPDTDLRSLRLSLRLSRAALRPSPPLTHPGSGQQACGLRRPAAAFGQRAASERRPKARAVELATACCCPGEGRARRGRGGRRASHSCRGGGVWDPDARASPASSLRARGFIVCNAQARRPVASLGCRLPCSIDS